MAQLVLQAAGYVIGSYFGYPQLGALIGTAVGAAVTANQTTRVQGPKIADLRVTGFEYGDPIPYVKGHPVIAGQIWWASSRRAIATTTSQGGKGGPTVENTTYTYEVDLLIGFTSNQMAALLRLWSTGTLMFNLLPSASNSAVAASSAISGQNWRRLTFYDGNATQLPDPTYEAAVGVGNANAYRRRSSIFLEGLQLGAGGAIPNITAEIASSGTPGAVGYNDNFNDGLTPYSVVTGSLSQFSGTSGDYGPQINCNGRLSVGIVDRIVRTVPTCVATGVRVKFAVTDDALDDAGQLTLETASGPTTTFVLTPRREQALDGARRVHVTINGTEITLGSSTIEIATEYQFDLSIAPGVNNGSTVTITRLPDGAVFFSGALAGIISTIAVDRQGFLSDSTAGQPTGAASFSDLQVIGSRAAITEETLQNVVSALCQRAGLATGQFDVTALSSITVPVRGMAVSQAVPTAQVLQLLMQCYFFECVVSDKLYFRPRGGSVAATIPFIELGASDKPEGEDEPLALNPANDMEVPAGWAITYMNVDADGSKDTQQSDRQNTVSRTIDAREVPLAFTAAEAKAIADTWRDDGVASAMGSTRISLDISHAAREPTDSVNVVAEDGSTFRLHLLRLTDSPGIRQFDAVLEDASAFTQTGTTSTDYTGSSSVTSLTETTLVLMDIAILRDADNDAGYYAAEKGVSTPWPGGKVFSSPDNATFDDMATITESAVIGTCSTTLGTWSGGNVFDETNSVTVNVGAGTLASDTRDNLLNLSTNAALIGGEIVQFRTATLSAAGIYVLTGLLRGRRGTESAMTGHAATERFVLLQTSGLRRIDVATGEIGALRYVRGVTLGRGVATAASQQITPAARGLKPFSPVDLRGTPAPGSDLALLLHFDGTTGSTTFTDSSLNAITFSAVGNAQISTAQSKFGGASLLCDGSGDSVKAAHNAAFDVPGGDFTIDMWVRLTSLAASQVFTVKATTTGFYPFQVTFDSASGKFTFAGFNSVNVSAYSIASTTAPTTGTFYHLACVRDGNTFRLYVNGVQEASATSSATLRSNSSDPIAIGGYENGAASTNGHIEEFRFIKGRCAYPGGSTFTPEVAAYSNPGASAGDKTFSWSRRTRLSENFNTSTHPLGESTEAYEVDIFSDSSFTTLKRTLSGLVTASATYTSAQQITDFGSQQSVVYVRVYQLSAIVGRGSVLQGSV